MPKAGMTGGFGNTNVLVAAATQTSYQTIHTILGGTFPRMSQTASMTQARQLVARGNVDQLVINTPMPDEFGLETALDLARRNPQLEILLLIKPDIYNQVSMRTRGSGICLLTKPLKGQVLLETVQNMENARQRILALAADNHRLKARLDEMGLITRAKCLLIERQHMTEEDSHRYLETTAMNTARSMIEVAREVVRELADPE